MREVGAERVGRAWSLGACARKRDRVKYQSLRAK